MDLKSLIDARLEMLGNDMPSGSCGLHEKTKREVIEKGIEFLQNQLTHDDIDEPSEYGYSISIEILKKGGPKWH